MTIRLRRLAIAALAVAVAGITTAAVRGGSDSTCDALRDRLHSIDPHASKQAPQRWEDIRALQDRSSDLDRIVHDLDANGCD